MIRHFLSVGVFISAIALTSCSGKEKEALKESSFNFTNIDSLIEKSNLDQALKESEGIKGLDRSDSLSLIEYIKFIKTIKSIQNQLDKNSQQQFLETVVAASRQNYKGNILGSGASEMYGYDKAYIYGWISLNTEPLELKIRTSYDDKVKGYYHHVITNISIVSGDNKVQLGHGFGVKGETNSRPLDFNISKKISKVENILKNEVVKLVYTTAKTYNDRAYHNGNIWDVKGGEVINYNNTSTFKERKSQILKKGDFKTFEIEVNKEAKKQITNLITVYKMLKDNNIKVSK